MPAPIRRILVTGDLLRPAPHGFRPAQAGNIAWIHALLRRALGQASGLPVERLAWREGFDTPAFYALAGEAPTLEGWAKLQDARSLPREALGLVARATEGASVVGFEMPGVLKGALSALGVPWIDLIVHPVRFLEDIFLAAQASHPDSFAALLDWHAEPGAFLGAADLLAAGALKLGLPPELPGDLLVVGQTRGDRTLIEEGRMLDLADRAEALAALAARHRGLLFKPHPYGDPEFGVLRGRLPFAALHWTHANLYALLAHPSVARVAGMSSSVLVEAGYFGKPATWLFRPAFDLATARATARPGQYLAIVEGLLDADLWRAALAPLMPVTARDGHRFRRRPDALRTALRNFWGYNEVTSDLVVAVAGEGQRRWS
jgi:hypothetical protein